MADAISAVRDAFIAVERGEIEQPQRLVARDGGLLLMAAGDVRGHGDVVKIISVTPENRTRHIPTVQGLVLWFDTKTGRPSLVIEGSTLTSLRTGAATGVATDLLAHAAASSLAMIGTGAQAMDQIRAVAAVRRITEVKVASRHFANAQEFVSLHSWEVPEATWRAFRRPAEAVAGTDIICCATTAVSPLFGLDDSGPEVHINAIGSYRPNMCELSADVLRAASILAVDLRTAALEEAGDIIQALDAGAISEESLVELGHLLAANNMKRHGRTVFKSVGIAAQDWALANVAAAHALDSTDLPRLDLGL